jgi:hypothetical protein
VSPRLEHLCLAAALALACTGPANRPRSATGSTGLGGFGPTTGTGGSETGPGATGGAGGEDASVDAGDDSGGTGGSEPVPADASAGTGGAIAIDAAGIGGSSGKLDASVGTGGSSGKLDASASTGGSSGKLDASAGTGGSSGKLDASTGIGGSSGKLDASAGTGGSSGKLDASAGTGGSSGKLDAGAGTGGATGTWMKANLTNFTSYPDPNSQECIVYNGCMWAGQFAFVSGTQPESWVMSHNIAAVHEKDGPTYKLKTLRLRQGSKTIDVAVYDACSDSDCMGCCTQNAHQNGLNFLIDIEKYTMQRFGTGDGIVEWMCLDCK